METETRKFRKLRLTLRVYDILNYICIAMGIYSLYKHTWIVAIIWLMIYFIVCLKADMLVLDYKDSELTEALRILCEPYVKEVEEDKNNTDIKDEI